MAYNGEFENDFVVANELGEILIPILNAKLKHGQVIHTENLKESVAQLLDKHSGVDGVFLSKKDLAGVALRVQNHSSKNWETFTIRYQRATGTETEYSKRKRQIYNSHPSFYPHYTCQAYFDNEKNLLGGAFCLTKDLFDIAIGFEPFEEAKEVYIQNNKSDGNTFIVVPFSIIERKLIF